MVYHLAAEHDGLVQRCSRCGAVLVDFSPQADVGELVRLTDATPTFFPVGQPVVDGGDVVKVHTGTAAGPCR